MQKVTHYLWSNSILNSGMGSYCCALLCVKVLHVVNMHACSKANRGLPCAKPYALWFCLFVWQDKTLKNMTPLYAGHNLSVSLCIIVDWHWNGFLKGDDCSSWTECIFFFHARGPRFNLWHLQVGWERPLTESLLSVNFELDGSSWMVCLMYILWKVPIDIKDSKGSMDRTEDRRVVIFWKNWTILENPVGL